MILSGLKTWLETGELLTTPGSLMVHVTSWSERHVSAARQQYQATSER